MFQNCLTKNEETHKEHLKVVLGLLQEHQLYGKLSKCKFWTQEIGFLGHVINEQGLAVDPEKVRSILDWKQPQCVREVRSFLGLAGYYRRFVPKFSVLAAPMTQLTRKNQKFIWETKCEESFQELKMRLTTAPVLVLPDPEKEYEVFTDASHVGLGCVLMQEKQAIAFGSRQLRPHEKKYPVHDLELAAVVFALKQWRHYLLGNKFQVFTDHKSLKYLFTQKDLNMRQRRWLEYLKDFDCVIEYTAGKANVVADALSRSYTGILKGGEVEPKAESLSITYLANQWLVKEGEQLNVLTITPEWRELIKQAQTDDQNIELISGQKRGELYQGFSFKQGVLYFQNRLYVPEKDNLRIQILEEAHSSKLSMHPGATKMYHTLRAYFWWPCMKKDISTHVASCEVCQQVKVEHQKPGGKLQSLPIPERKWGSISMDFVVGMPLTRRKHDAIWVIVDRLTKAAHFLPMNLTDSLDKLAQLYIREIVRLHGIPDDIVSDRDPRFVSRFWKSLHQALGTKLKFSSAYHPQTDG